MNEPTGNPNALAALWLAVTIGQNWKGNSFNWDDSFVAGLPRDINPAVKDSFEEVKNIVETNPQAFASVANAWLDLAGRLGYRAPEVQPGITNLALRPR